MLIIAHMFGRAAIEIPSIRLINNFGVTHDCYHRIGRIVWFTTFYFTESTHVPAFTAIKVFSAKFIYARLRIAIFTRGYFGCSGRPLINNASLLL